MGFFDLFKGQEKQKEEKRTVLNLELNDIVEYDLEEYKVIGIITYQQFGYEWYDYHLINQQNSCWLYAERDDCLELILFEKVAPKHKIYNNFSQEIPQTITYQNQQFNLIEQGQAKIKVKGQVGAKTGQDITYYDYQNNNKIISVEKWGSELEISIGHSIKESLIEIYPAEGE